MTPAIAPATAVVRDSAETLMMSMTVFFPDAGNKDQVLPGYRIIGMNSIGFLLIDQGRPHSFAANPFVSPQGRGMAYAAVRATGGRSRLGAREDRELATADLRQPFELEGALPELEDVDIEVALVEHEGATERRQITLQSDPGCSPGRWAGTRSAPDRAVRTPRGPPAGAGRRGQP
jgi:hypothetical protein